MLGSGYRDKPDDFNYEVSDHAEYLLDFITYLDLNQFMLFGQSLGGAVALSLADRCRGHIARIILSEANLDSGGGSTSRAITAYEEKDFYEQGFKNIILESQKTSNEMWVASFSVSSPKAVYLASKSAELKVKYLHGETYYIP